MRGGKRSEKINIESDSRWNGSKLCHSTCWLVGWLLVRCRYVMSFRFDGWLACPSVHPSSLPCQVMSCLLSGCSLVYMLDGGWHMNGVTSRADEPYVNDQVQGTRGEERREKGGGNTREGTEPNRTAPHNQPVCSMRYNSYLFLTAWLHLVRFDSVDRSITRSLARWFDRCTG